MIYISIEDEPIEAGKPYTDQRTGMTSIRPGKQNAYLHQGAAYPTPFKINVDDRTGPLRPGRYALAGNPFQPGQFGLDFRSNKIELVPLEEAIKAWTADKGGNSKLAAVG